jgi:hypothetical protein
MRKVFRSLVIGARISHQDWERSNRREVSVEIATNRSSNLTIAFIVKNVTNF